MRNLLNRQLIKPHFMALRIKVVSGGQTGVDRAALDAALEYGVECGGWCPEGRLADDGSIDPRYPLTVTSRAIQGVSTQPI